MADSARAAIAVNRFGLGARPGELQRAAEDPEGWLGAQLAASPPRVAGAGLRASADILSQALELRRERRAVRAGDASESADAAVVMKIGQLFRPIYVDEATARIRTAFASDR